MLMKMFVTAIMMSTLIFAADEEVFNLKLNMLKLNVKLGQAREALIRDERESSLRSFAQLKTDVRELLSNKERIESLLPEGKRQKSEIALDAAKRITDNIEIIEDAFGENKRQLSPLKRQATAQRAYTSIEIACFHCHNLVRDQQ